MGANGEVAPKNSTFMGQLFVYKTPFGLWFRNHWWHRKTMLAKTSSINSRSFYIFIKKISVSCLFTYKPKCKQKTDRNWQEFLDGHFLDQNPQKSFFEGKITPKNYFLKFFYPYKFTSGGFQNWRFWVFCWHFGQ